MGALVGGHVGYQVMGGRGRGGHTSGALTAHHGMGIQSEVLCNASCSCSLMFMFIDVHVPFSLTLMSLSTSVT